MAIFIPGTSAGTKSHLICRGDGGRTAIQRWQVEVIDLIFYAPGRCFFQFDRLLHLFRSLYRRRVLKSPDLQLNPFLTDDLICHKHE